MSGQFEGSYLGDARRLSPDAVMECKICWHVYDPAQGCESWQIPPGTAFADLPPDWRCPECDGAHDQFMVVSAGTVLAAPPPGTAAPQTAPDPLAQLVAAWPGRLEAAFREIHIAQMRGIPLLNEALAVKAVGFRAYDGRVVGVLITPWFMNLIQAGGPDDDWSAIPSGTKEKVDFPSGIYEFTAVNRDDLPPYRACSLFSPVYEFTTMLQATETAQAVMTALFDPSLREEPETPPAQQGAEAAVPPAVVPASAGSEAARPADEPPPARRDFLFGARKPAPEA